MLPDPASDWKLTKICPDVADRWKKARQALWDSHQVQIKITDGYRNFSEQFAVWSKGRKRDKQGNWTISDPTKVVTHSMPGQSYHNYSLAIDSAFMGEDPYLAKLEKDACDKLWQAYGDAVKAQGMEWGGDWEGAKNDRPHCQVSYGLSVHTCQIVYENSGIPGVWNRCKNSLLDGREIV